MKLGTYLEYSLNREFRMSWNENRNAKLLPAELIVEYPDHGETVLHIGLSHQHMGNSAITNLSGAPKDTITQLEDKNSNTWLHTLASNNTWRNPYEHARGPYSRLLIKYVWLKVSGERQNGQEKKHVTNEMREMGNCYPKPVNNLSRSATRNLGPDTMLGEEGTWTKMTLSFIEVKFLVNFSQQYRSKINFLTFVVKLNNRNRIIHPSIVHLNSEPISPVAHGLEEWQAEVDFLGRVSHLNLVKLLGFCCEGKELLLVYEFMQKRSLENHLFGRGSTVQPLPWDFRLKIFLFYQSLILLAAPQCMATAKGAAETLKFNMAIVLLPVSRNTITWLRSTKLSYAILFDDNINFHKRYPFQALRAMYKLHFASKWFTLPLESYYLNFSKRNWTKMTLLSFIGLILLAAPTCTATAGSWSGDPDDKGLISLADHKNIFQVVTLDDVWMWNEWVLRGLILISLISQIALSLLGYIRKYNWKTPVRMGLWCTCLLAYSVVPAALGMIIKTNSEPTLPVAQPHRLNTSELMSFWAPFLFLHLGGPDSITAFALEDSELYLRYFVEMVFLAVVALYILLQSWPGYSYLPQLSILVYLAGFVKCFERIQALRLVNTGNLRKSMLSHPDPGPNSRKLLEDLHLKKSQRSTVSDTKHEPRSVNLVEVAEPLLPQDNKGSRTVISERIQALRLSKTENLLDLMPGPPDSGPNYPKFPEDLHLKKSRASTVEVEVIREAPLISEEVEKYLKSLEEKNKLNLDEVAETPFQTGHKGSGTVISDAYGLFQTFKRLFENLVLTFEDRDDSQSYFRHLKSDDAFHIVEIELGFAFDMLYTKANVVYTFMGLMLRLTSFFFLLMVLVCFYILYDIDYYPSIDIVITYLLVCLAIFMEMFSVITMLRSDWTDHWLSQRNLTRNILVFPFLKQPTKQRWSGSIGQFDLLSVAIEEKPATCLKIRKFFGIDFTCVKHRYKTYSKVSDNLKRLIYNHFRELMVFNFPPKELCSHKGSFSLRKNECDSLLWSTTNVEFDRSILIWHIATTLCYDTELDNQDDGDIYARRTESKHISDYLLYLLVSYPLMLPVVIGMVRYHDTCAEAMRFFKTKGPKTAKVEACRKLLQVEDAIPCKVKGGQSKSALYDGRRLALALKEMGRERMWKVISQVWIEILGYAATHCKGFHHKQHLGKGGEFLTHVWLLMAHLGITEQFQEFQGHSRAKINF